MKTVNIHEAKTHLSKLIQNVLDGEEVVISKYGKPVVRMEAYQKKYNRKPGMWEGQIAMEPDFDELPEDITEAFNGESD